jgi:hypothetical protein
MKEATIQASFSPSPLTTTLLFLVLIVRDTVLPVALLQYSTLGALPRKRNPLRNPINLAQNALNRLVHVSNARRRVDIFTWNLRSSDGGDRVDGREDLADAFDDLVDLEVDGGFSFSLGKSILVNEEDVPV